MKNKEGKISMIITNVKSSISKCLFKQTSLSTLSAVVMLNHTSHNLALLNCSLKF